MAKSRVASVYESIIRRIIENDLQPGAPVNRREVAERLGVSISPVSEAFAILQSQEIIVTVPRKGTFIAKLDWQELADLTNVRVALETEAAKTYAGKILKANRDIMLAKAQKIENTKKMTYEHLAADIDLHRSLVALAGNKYLSRLFDQVITHSLLLAMEATMSLMINPEDDLSHVEFIEKLEKTPAGRVDALIRRNIYAGKKSFIEAGRNKRLNAMDEKEKTSPDDNHPLDMILSSMGD